MCDFTIEKWCPVQELDLSKKKWLRGSKKTSLLVVQKPSINLVGGAITILKNDGLRQWVSNDIPYIIKNRTCLKPPTRNHSYWGSSPFLEVVMLLVQLESSWSFSTSGLPKSPILLFWAISVVKLRPFQEGNEEIPWATFIPSGKHTKNYWKLPLK